MVPRGETQLFDVAQYASSVAGFHGGQSNFQCGNEVEEGAGVCLENPASVLPVAVC